MRKHLTASAIVKVAQELNRTKSAEELATEFGVSSAAIYQCATKLRKKGVIIPRLQNGGVLKAALAILSAKHPELVS